MKIDLHVHTKERSACGEASADEQVRAAIDAGLDALAFTDHGQLAPAERIAELNETYAPFRIFGGIEIDIPGEHIIVLGINDSRLMTNEWSYPELHAFVREHDGFLALAHPFRYHADIKPDIERYPLDAMEAYSTNTPPAAADRILELAARLRIPTLSNSDAHKTAALGRYFNVMEHTPADERELINMLKQGAFVRRM